MTAAATDSLAAPRRRLTLREQLLLSLHWFGLNFHWGALLIVAIPASVLRFVSPGEEGRALGLVFGLGAAIALLVQPLAGAWSDRSTLSLGRRRPFLIAGTLLNAAGLLAMAYAPSLTLFAAAFWFLQFANNFGGTAYSGLIPDLVPPDQRGSASGFMGLMTMLGTVLGGLVAGLLMERGLAVPLFSLVAAVLLGTMTVTVWQVHEQRQTTRVPLRAAEFIARFWVNPRRHPDFAWLFLSRFLTLMGFYSLVSFLLLFLRDYLGVREFKQAAGLVQAAVIVGALGSAFLAGWLSDRVGRRGIVSGATALMGVVVLLFLLAPSFALLLPLGVIFGVGYGAFTSVDWALAVDVLPSPASAAKDLGIWGISATLPQVLAAPLGGLLLDAVNRLGPNQGYVALNAVGGVYFFVGALAIWKIRGIR